MVVRTRTEQLAAAAPRGDGALPLRPPPRLRPVRANGDCELQRLADDVGLADVRYGWAAPTHLATPTDESQPVLHLRPGACIVCSRCVRACDETQGTFALTDRGPRFDSRIAAGPAPTFLASECVSCGACVQACPTDALTEKSVVELGHADAHGITTCAYCGVGCSFKAEMQGDARSCGWCRQGRRRQPGPLVRQGPLRLGLRHRTATAVAPMVRDSIDRRVAGGRRGTRPSRCAATGFKRHPGQVRRRLDRRHHVVALHQRRGVPRAEAGARRVRQQQRRHLRARLPLAHRLRPQEHASATRPARRTSTRSMHADVILVIGANPTDAHPVFASRMKRRLREGAQADRRRPAPHRPGAHAARRGRLPPQLRPGTNVAFVNALAHVVVTEGLIDRASSSRDAASDASTSGTSSSPTPSNSPGGDGGRHRRAGRRRARGRAAVRDRRQRGDLLRPRRHRAQPGLDDGHGHGEPRHGHRQHRPRRRRRQPAARPEQRAGLVRHGLVPARVPRLPPRLATTRCATIFEELWGVDAPGRARPAHPEHVRRGARRHLQGRSTCRARTSRSPTPTPSTSSAALRCDGMRRRAGPVPQRDRQVRARVPARLVVPREGRHVHQRRAAHQPRAQGHAAAQRQARVGNRRASSPQALGYPMDYAHRREIMDEIAALDADLHGVSLRPARRARQRSSGRATTTRPTARRRCTSTAFVRGKGRFIIHRYVPTERAHDRASR